MCCRWLPSLVLLLAAACGSRATPESGVDASEVDAGVGDSSDFDEAPPSETTVAGEGQAPIRFADFEEELREIAEADELQGLSVAVVDSEGVLWSQGVGYADLDESHAITADTLFHIGSTHKALNAFFVATLVEDGFLDWDTTLTDLVPDFDLEPEITIRHLLTMTAGISADAEDELGGDLDDVNLPPNEIASVVFESIVEADLLADPGQVFEYSNISASAAGYSAAAAVEPDNENLHALYLELFTERVFAPLGMHDSTLFVSEAIESGTYSAAFTVEAGLAVGSGLAVAESLDSDTDLLAPSGSVKSSANDMALFLQALLNDGISASGNPIISSESIATMWQPALENYAMGWEISEAEGLNYLSHEGSFDGYLSIILLVPDEGLGLVILTNSEEAGEGLISAVPGLFLTAISSR